MPNPVLSDVQTVSFKGIDFNAQVVEWTDTRKPRFALHEYLKRDGAEAEYMGRSPHRAKFNIVFVGKDWKKGLLALQSSIDDNPIGLLVHPFYGSMQAICEGIDGAHVNVESAIDMVTVPISFVESNLDQRIQAANSEGPAAKNQKIVTYAAGLNTATSIYATASAIFTYVNLALQYGISAVATITSTGVSIFDATIPGQLQAVAAAANTARTAVRSDPAWVNDAVGFPVISGIELLLDACNQMDEALKAFRPTMAQYTVSSQTTLLALAQTFYGKDAASRLDEIRLNNVGKIPTPAAILPGTVLLMATATVKPPAL